MGRSGEDSNTLVKLFKKEDFQTVQGNFCFGGKLVQALSFERPIGFTNLKLFCPEGYSRKNSTKTCSRFYLSPWCMSHHMLTAQAAARCLSSQVPLSDKADWV